MCEMWSRKDYKKQQQKENLTTGQIALLHNDLKYQIFRPAI